MSFKITEKVTTLVEELFKEGYQGDCEFTNSYCTGTYEVLGDAYSLKLSGFCKESLHVVENTETGEIYFVGRYSTEAVKAEPTVEDIVSIAWIVYKCYNDRGYSMPSEFKDLFVKYGYLTKKTITKEVWEEN